jgi:hypothetical protein
LGTTPFANPNAAALANLYGSAALANSLYGTAGAGSLYSSPNGGLYSNGSGSGYGSNYFMDPAYGYLKGGADAITSQGNFLVSQQQAVMLKQKTETERLTNRRKAFDELVYERDKSPSPEEEKRQFESRQLSHSLNRPAQTEIWSGKALNDILADLGQRITKPGDSASLDLPISLAPNSLGRINVIKNGVGLGLLRDVDHLHWPLALGDRAFKEARERFTEQAVGAVHQLKFGNEVPPRTLGQLLNDLDELHRQLRRMGRGLSAVQYVEANSFLNHLDDAFSVLKKPNAVDYFTGKYTLKTKTVDQLVRWMIAEGLQFAAALPGDEAAYAALYQALATYHAATLPQAAH